MMTSRDRICEFSQKIIIEHNRDATFYSYGSAHQECMQHSIRYLVGNAQNEGHLTWNSKILELVREMVHW